MTDGEGTTAAKDGDVDYVRPSLPPDGHSGFAQAIRVCQDAVTDRIVNRQMSGMPVI